MCTRARCFFARFNRLKLSAPLVEASPGHPELLGQLIDTHTGPHVLYGHALKLPGISLSSLHLCFLSRRVCPSRVCQFKGSFQLPLIQWTTVRLVVSENDWRRHGSEMEPQGRGSVSPLRTRRRNRALGLSKTTLRSRVHVQTVGLKAATKKDRHRAGRGALSLDIPFYRTCPSSANRA